MNQQQWVDWLQYLKVMNRRDWIIARVVLGGCRRISEVLELDVSSLDIANGQICFNISKSKVQKQVVITYSKGLINDIKAHVGQRKEGWLI